MHFKFSRKILYSGLNYLQNRKIPLQFKFNHLFSTSNDQSLIQKLDRSKCQLAQMVLKIIQNKQNYQNLKNCSLRDYILIKINKNQDAQPQAKSQISSLFSEGVPITQQFKQVYAQERIMKQLRFPIAQKQLNQKNRLIFYPTYSITSKIFQKINDYQNNRILLTGYSGFSKTFSLLLYSRLTNYIIDYRFKYPNQIKNLSNSIQKRPKVFYNYPNIYRPKPQLQDHSLYIQYNCKQLQHQNLVTKLTQNQSIKSSRKGFKQIYKETDSQILAQYSRNNGRAILFVDQFHQVLAIQENQELINKWKYFKNKNIPIKNLKQFTQQQLQTHKQSLKKLKILKRKNIQLFHHFKQLILLSNSEFNDKQMIKRLNFTGYDQQQSLQTQNLKFIANQNQQQLFIQMIDFFIFQLGLKCKLNPQHFSENWFTSIQPQYMQLRNKIRSNLLSFKNKQLIQQFTQIPLSPLIIRQFFTTQLQKQKNHIGSIKQHTDIVKYLEQIFEKCNKFTIKPYQQKFDTYLNKENRKFYKSLKKAVLWHLLMCVFSQIKGSPIKIKMYDKKRQRNNFQQPLQKLIIKHRDQVSLQQIFQITENGQIILYVTARLYKKIYLQPKFVLKQSAQQLYTPMWEQLYQIEMQLDKDKKTFNINSIFKKEFE